MQFVFHPGYKGVAARCDVWPNQNIGWTPKPGVWHNLKVTLRSSGTHTFPIGDGQDEDKVWQKDLQKPGLFGNEIRVRAKPHLPDGLLPKVFEVVEEEVTLENCGVHKFRLIGIRLPSSTLALMDAPGACVSRHLLV